MATPNEREEITSDQDYKNTSDTNNISDRIPDVSEITTTVDCMDTDCSNRSCVYSFLQPNYWHYSNCY